MYNASMNFYLQKSPHNQHEVNAYHILEQNIIRYNYMKYYPQEQLTYAQTVILHMYSYENMPAKDQKSEFTPGYTQKFHHSKLLRVMQQTDDQ